MIASRAVVASNRDHQNSHQRQNSHQARVRRTEIRRENDEIWWLFWWLFVSNFCAFSCEALQTQDDSYRIENEIVVQLCAIHCDSLQNHKNGTQIRRGQPSGGSTPLPAPIKSMVYQIDASSDAFFCAQSAVVSFSCFFPFWLFSPSCTCDVRLVRALSFLTVAAHSSRRLTFCRAVELLRTLSRSRTLPIHCDLERPRPLLPIDAFCWGLGRDLRR
jgi:hypothetical protein